MRKTKIICTMGPSTDKGDVMEKLVREGMDVARFNFSHGPHDEQRGRIQNMTDLLQHFLIQRGRRSDLDVLRKERFPWKKDSSLHLPIKILKELTSM